MDFYLLVFDCSGSRIFTEMLVISASVYMKHLAQQLNAVLAAKSVYSV